MGEVVICVGVITARFARPLSYLWEAAYVRVIMVRESLSCILQRNHDRFSAQEGVSRCCVAGHINYFATSRPCVRCDQRVFLLPDRRDTTAYGVSRCGQFTYLFRYYRGVALHVQRFGVDATTKFAARFEQFAGYHRGRVHLKDCARDLVGRFLHAAQVARFAARRNDFHLSLDVVRRV